MNLDHLPDLMVLDERGVGLSRALGDGRFSEPNYFDLPPQEGLRAINATNDRRTDVLTFSDEELCVLLATGEVVVEAPRCICPPSRNSALK